MAEPLHIARAGDLSLALLPNMANRHGLITGATGTGKTVTLQSLAERFSYIGTPVFMADVKGDLSGMAAAGTVSPKLQQRLDMLGITDFVPTRARSASGTCSANPATRYAPPSATWARCCWPVCSV